MSETLPLTDAELLFELNKDTEWKLRELNEDYYRMLRETASQG